MGLMLLSTNVCYSWLPCKNGNTGRFLLMRRLSAVQQHVARIDAEQRAQRGALLGRSHLLGKRALALPLLLPPLLPLGWEPAAWRGEERQGDNSRLRGRPSRAWRLACPQATRQLHAHSVQSTKAASHLAMSTRSSWRMRTALR